MTRVYNYLQKNPRTEKTVELSLLEIGINYYHLISLLWNPDKKTFTNDFLIWKTREIIEILVTLSINNNLNILDVNKRVKDAFETCQKIKEEEEIYIFIGTEIDNHPTNMYALTLDMKIALLFRALEFKGITLDQIFAKYEN